MLVEGSSKQQQHSYQADKHVRWEQFQQLQHRLMQRQITLEERRARLLKPEVPVPKSE